LQLWSSAAFLMPELASKNDARHMASGYPIIEKIDAMSGIFLTPSLASKYCRTLYLQSITQLWQTSLQFIYASALLTTGFQRLKVQCRLFSNRSEGVFPLNFQAKLKDLMPKLGV